MANVEEKLIFLLKRGEGPGRDFQKLKDLETVYWAEWENSICGMLINTKEKKTS